MCSARLFAVRVILLQRFKVLPARLPDFGSLPTLTKGSSNGRQARLCRKGWRRGSVFRRRVRYGRW